MDITILISFDGSSTSRHTTCKLKTSPDIRSAWYSGCLRFHHVNCAFRGFFYLTEYVGIPKCPGSTDDLDRIDT